MQHLVLREEEKALDQRVLKQQDQINVEISTLERFLQFPPNRPRSRLGNLDMKIGIHDTSVIYDDQNIREALNNSISVGEAADRLGYHRYWFAEHHLHPSFASCAPELLIPILASRSSRMRIGAGGIMLANYQPFKVAETFLLLNQLFDGRIDLGIGSSHGADDATAKALAGDSKISVQTKLKALLEALQHLSQSKPFSYHPRLALPELWLLTQTSQLSEAHREALESGYNMAFAQFFQPETDYSHSLATLKQTVPTRKAMICLSVLTSPDLKGLEDLKRYHYIHSTLAAAKQPARFPTRDYQLPKTQSTHPEFTYLHEFTVTEVSGRVAERVLEIASHYMNADEIMLNLKTDSYRARIQVLEQLRRDLPDEWFA